jgi:hypothetical protein
MRVAHISKANGPFELVEREIPEPGPNTVRVAIDACGGGGGGSGLGVEGLRMAVLSTTGPVCGQRAAPPTLHAGFRPSPEWSPDEPIVSETHQF